MPDLKVDPSASAASPKAASSAPSSPQKSPTSPFASSAKRQLASKRRSPAKYNYKANSSSRNTKRSPTHVSELEYMRQRMERAGYSTVGPGFQLHTHMIPVHLFK